MTVIQSLTSHQRTRWPRSLVALVIARAVNRLGSFAMAFLAVALFAHLRRGAWRPEGRRLSWAEAAKATGLFVITALLCAGVGLAATIPVETGAGAFSLAGYLGLDR